MAVPLSSCNFKNKRYIYENNMDKIILGVLKIIWKGGSGETGWGRGKIRLVIIVEAE
jgi:hypothetical protein